MVHKALRTPRKDMYIIILPVDKERIMVILNKTDYIEKAKQLLNNTTTYRLHDTNATGKSRKRSLRPWWSKKTSKGLPENAGKWELRPPMLPKIRKERFRLRPAVSFHGTPKYRLGKELWRHVELLISGSTDFVTNPYRFLEKTPPCKKRKRWSHLRSPLRLTQSTWIYRGK